MRGVALIGGVGLALVLVVPAALAQELRLELARKRHEVVRPAPDLPAAAREAEGAVREYEAEVAREHLARERVLGELRERDRRRELDTLITQQIQALQLQRALREFRR